MPSRSPELSDSQWNKENKTKTKGRFSDTKGVFIIKGSSPTVLRLSTAVLNYARPCLAKHGRARGLLYSFMKPIHICTAVHD